MKLKKMLAILLAVALVLPLSLGVAAAPASDSRVLDKAQKLVSSSIRNPYNSYESGTYSLGAELPTYLLQGGALTEFSGVRFFPVYCNGQLSGIVKINGADTSEPMYTFSRYFSTKLRELTNNGSLDVLLVVGDTQVFAVVNGTATEVADYAVGAPTSRLSAGTVESRVSTERAALRSVNGAQKTALNTQVARGVGSAGWLNVLQHRQGDSELICWAVSAWCIGEFMVERGKTIAQVISSAGAGAEGTPLDIQAALTNSYGLGSTYYPTSLTRSQIIQKIDIGAPFSAKCHIPNSTKLGHTITGMGYDDIMANEADFILWVMDSLSNQKYQGEYDCIVAIIRDSPSGRFYWQGTAGRYDWIQTVALIHW